MLKAINTTNNTPALSFCPFLLLFLLSLIFFFLFITWLNTLYSLTLSYREAHIFFISFFVSSLCLLVPCTWGRSRWALMLACSRLCAHTLASLCSCFTSRHGVVGRCPCCQLEPGGKGGWWLWSFWLPIQQHCIVRILLKRWMWPQILGAPADYQLIGASLRRSSLILSSQFLSCIFARIEAQ